MVGAFTDSGAGAHLTLLDPSSFTVESPLQQVPRAIGEMDLVAKRRGGLTVIDTFRASGALKSLYPPPKDHLEAIVINTSGGLTGGDAMTIRATALEDASLTLTTQAAERGYKSALGTAHVRTHLTAAQNATLRWLPQELILYDAAALDRRLDIDLDAQARLLLVEPIIFGRTAMGEVLATCELRDRIMIRVGGSPYYADGATLSGAFAPHQMQRAGLNGAAAMASVVYRAPDAEAHLDPVRALLTETGGASLLSGDLLVVRLVAPGAMELRRSLIPVLDRLSQNTLPKSWRL